MDPFISKYDLLDPISVSQDSDVYLIRTKDREEYFLLKSLKEGVSGAREGINRKIRFRREMDIVSALDHPKIAHPIATFADDKTYSIIYPFRKGQTLAKLLNEGAFFTEIEAINIILQVLDALEYIHSRALVHADINPHNIFLDDDKGIELLDFGVSMTEDEARRLPEGRIIGTIPYLSPEQMGFTDFKIDTRSDLYCAALIFYRLLAGKLPFTLKEESISELLTATLKREVKPIASAAATLNSILLKALKPSPDDRYQTAVGLKADLRFALKESEGHTDEFFIFGETDAIASVNRTKLFVSREKELAWLDKGFKRLLNHEFASFLIYGRSGVGKTEIVRQFISSIEESYCWFLPVKCNPFTPHQPYSIFRHIVCEFIARIIRDTEDKGERFGAILNEKMADSSGVICATLPELKEFFTAVAEIDRVEPEKEADRIVHVLSTLLLTLCEVKPLIIFIDDLQWIDQVTFEIARKIMALKPPCMLIFNFRTSVNDSDLFACGLDLRLIGIERLIPVEPFSLQETRDLVESRFGRVNHDAELIEILFSRTDGNPFVLSEAIRFMVNAAMLIREERGWSFDTTQISGLPKKFDPISLILKKEENFNNDERTCLRLAALIQGKFDARLFQLFSGFSETQVRIFLHLLETLGFIIAHFKGGYSFSHDRIQETVADGIPADERTCLYERLGKLYEAMIADNPENIFNAAEYWLKTKNLAKTIDICFRAATFAVEKIAFDVAMRYFKNTEFLIKQCPKFGVLSPVDPVKVEVAFGDVLMLTGKNEQALKIFESLITKVDILSTGQLIEIKYKIGSIYQNLGNFEESIIKLKDALSDAGLIFPAKRATVIIDVCIQMFKQVLFSVGLKHLLPEKTDIETRMIVRILNKLTYSLYFYDMIACLLANFKALSIADLLDDCFEKAEAYACHILPAYQLLFKKRSLKYCSKSHSISTGIRRKDCSGYSLSMWGLVNYFRGAWLDSTKMLEGSIADYTSVGNISGQILSAEHLWRVAYYRGSLAHAQSHITKTIQLCAVAHEKHFLMATKSAQYLIQYLQSSERHDTLLSEINTLVNSTNIFLSHSHVGIFLMQAELLEGKIEDAFKRYTSLFGPSLTKCFNSEYVVPIYALTCELLLKELKNRSASQQSLSISTPQVKNHFHRNCALLRFSCLSFPAWWGSYYRCKAWWHALKGNNGKANRYFLKSIGAHHNLDMRYEEARSVRDYAVFLEEHCTMPGTARDRYNEAYRLFAWCGAKLETDRIRDKVDPAVVQIAGGVISAEVVDGRQVTSTTTTAGINQMRVNMLFDLSNTIRNTDDINELLHRILRSMINATGGQFGALFVAGDEHHPKRSLFMDFDGTILSSKQVAYSKTIIDRVNQTHETILIRDGLTAQEIGEESHKEIRSVLCLPLLRAEKSLGCIYLGNNIVSAIFSEESQKTAQIIAGQAGVLLENAYLMDSLKRLNRDLHKKVRDQTRDIREKNQQVEEYNIKLVEAERMKNLLTHTLVHDIKNYVMGVQGSVDLLRSREFDSDKRRMLLGKAYNSCLGIANLSNNLLDIGKMEDGKLEVDPRPMRCQDVINLANKFTEHIAFDEQNIQVLMKPLKDDFTIEADAYLLDRVLQNLFSNAAKYVPQNGRVELSFESTPAENSIVFFSSGEPIAAEHRVTLFEKYTTAGRGTTEYSKGLGLFFCRMVMLAHKGRIWLDTDVNGNYFKMGFRRKA
jgi:serine/threonine protein kinase/signal transduction histidine kinase/tetratricopeptide (TPR) repeat protein